MNPEIGFFDFKCLGKISGSSLLQNYKIDSNIENIDLVVYPSITSPLFVGRAKSIDAINYAMNSNEKQ